ncbi:MAG: hypothetical protein O3A00_11220, partial [Planctomycetota bacterium]|nr:hypothetical protein [Planctomycetota bacterium]
MWSFSRWRNRKMLFQWAGTASFYLLWNVLSVSQADAQKTDVEKSEDVIKSAESALRDLEKIGLGTNQGVASLKLRIDSVTNRVKRGELTRGLSDTLSKTGDFSEAGFVARSDTSSPYSRALGLIGVAEDEQAASKSAAAALTLQEALSQSLKINDADQLITVLRRIEE